MGHQLLSLLRRVGDTRSDADLVAAIGDHSAFAEVVTRHGPMVWGVCRHLLGEADAEDAFQATFLALLRSSMRDGATLASWLHGVALRVSLSARRQAGRRQSRERAVAVCEATVTQSPNEWADTMAIVHREVARLPDADRSAFVLCVLEGLTQADAAVRLGRTPGAVAGQVTRAKRRLIERLTGRGIVPALAALGAASVAGAVPAALMEKAINLPASAVSPAVLRLTQGALGMTTSRAKVASALLVGFVVSIGAWVAVAGPPACVDPPGRVPVAADAPATDWPMGGRSADRNPVSPEKHAPTGWQVPEEDKKARNVRWSVRLGTNSIGGPVVSDGLVWVGTNNQTSDENLPDFAVLACYRESDGKLLSRYLSPRRGEGTAQDCPHQSLSGSPLVEGDRLWFCTNRREVVCLDIGPLRRGTGEPRELWKLDMVGDLKVCPCPVCTPSHDFLGSPVAYKEFLYVPTGNGTSEDGKTVPSPDAPALVCVRKDTGKMVWSDNSPGKNILYGHSGNPLVIVVGGRGQVIHPQADGWVRAFDADTGNLVWKFDVNPVGTKGDLGLGGNGKRVHVLGTPVYAEGKVYFGSGIHADAAGTHLGRLFCVDPTKTGDVSPEVDDGTGKGRKNPNSAVAWEYTRAHPKEGFHLMLSSVAVHDGLLYAADFYGIVHCLDAKTGERHWWLDVKAHVFGNPLVVGGKVYVGTWDGDTFVFATGKTKQLLAKNEMSGGMIAPPVFANGTLYVLGNRHLHAIAEGAPK